MRLFLRLTTEVTDRLRPMTRYHGELSRYIDEVLSAADLETVELLSAESGRGRGITAVLSHSVNGRLRYAAKQRGCTVAALANGALKQWLGGKHADRRQYDHASSDNQICFTHRCCGCNRRSLAESVALRGVAGEPASAKKR